MKTFNILSCALLVLCMLNICGALEADESGKKKSISRQLGTTTPAPKPPPKKKPNTSGTGGGSSSGSGSGSSSGSTSGTGSSASAAASQTISPTKASSASGMLLGAAGVAVAAAAMFHKRRAVVTEVPHPLEGSLAKRVENFEKFVGHSPSASPNSKNGSAGMDYNAMPDNAAMV